MSIDVPAAEFTDLAAQSTDELCASARNRRDELFGPRVTYSPKVFIPLTKLCRDQCGYCTFAQPPSKVSSPYLSADEILAIAHAGAEAGCHEALFTLGERPELRYPAAAAWLAARGYSSTVEYLVAMCELVRHKTGLLPHANPGSMTFEELRALRTVAVSQGMMIETLRPDLDCHRNAPDKTAKRRLNTLTSAGKLSIPFTTGILVGIGENELDRIKALTAIARSAAEFGHVQEVIVQNFLPKARTAMWRAEAAPAEEFERAIALARLILPATVHLQAPPNLSDNINSLVACGVDDLGGISPVTTDHVNPERPWPTIDRLRKTLARAGHQLAPRLTIYPEYAAQPTKWLDARLCFGVLDHSDAENFCRDDPGPFFIHQTATTAGPPGGTEVRLESRRAATWYSGSSAAAPALLRRAEPANCAKAATRNLPVASAAVAAVLDGVSNGEEAGREELRTLLAARGADVAHVASAADGLRRAVSGDVVTYVANRNINYTNVCTFKCRFCGFSKGPASLNLRGKPYLLTLEDIKQRVIEAWEGGATEVCLQGGIHPDFDGDYYLRVCEAVHAAAPNIHIHGFTALEVTEGARRSGVSLETYLAELRSVGLRSLPGTAAEILDDDVRAVLCPDKISTSAWLEAHEVAHSVGLRSNVTMMFGSIESPDSQVSHLLRTRDLQRRTEGFTEFVGLPFVHMAAPIYLQRSARRGPTFRETVLVHAVARIAYHRLIDNIQASWVKVGFEGLSQLLNAGCNDVGGTLTDENISRAAGAEHGQSANLADFERVTQSLGRGLKQRTTLYQPAENSPVRS